MKEIRYIILFNYVLILHTYTYYIPISYFKFKKKILKKLISTIGYTRNGRIKDTGQKVVYRKYINRYKTKNILASYRI